jgi:hypothetical protein
MRDEIWVETQWVKKGKIVYRRERWEGSDWSKWEVTPMYDVPYFILKHFPLDKAAQ